ncbi:MAG: 2Fe-2S iron-sulfur cluster-binding protein, partial [Zestosphaera sp.]
MLKSGNSKSLLELLKDKEISVRSDCGGIGICGKCVVKVLAGVFSDTTLCEYRVLGDQVIKEGFRLAC